MSNINMYKEYCGTKFQISTAKLILGFFFVFFLLFLKDRALDYLSTCIDQVQTFGDILQLVIVELIYKVQ